MPQRILENNYSTAKFNKKLINWAKDLHRPNKENLKPKVQSVKPKERSIRPNRASVLWLQSLAPWQEETTQPSWMNFKSKRKTLKNKLKPEDKNSISWEVRLIQVAKLKALLKQFHFLISLHWKTKLKKPKRTKLELKRNLNQPKNNQKTSHQKLNQQKRQLRKQSLKTINSTIRQRNLKKKEANSKRTSHPIIKSQSMRRKSQNNWLNWETRRPPLRKKQKKKLKRLRIKRIRPMIWFQVQLLKKCNLELREYTRKINVGANLLLKTRLWQNKIKSLML